jgi:hypothetical protein
MVANGEGVLPLAPTPGYSPDTWRLWETKALLALLALWSPTKALGPALALGRVLVVIPVLPPALYSGLPVVEVAPGLVLKGSGRAVGMG